MGTISSGIGLVSGINSKEIIDQLMSLEARPKTKLQSRIDATNQQKFAFTELSARLTTLRLSTSVLKKVSTFNQRSAVSSNENVLTASAASSAARGTYQFQVARLVTTQQSVSTGYANTDTQRVGAGTITIEMGGGEIYSQTPLSQLNGGAGVRRGVFRITDRSGQSGLVDISTAVTLDDVVKKINTNLDISVRAEVSGNTLKITDLTGQGGNLSISDVGAGFAAADLGITGSVAGATLTGTRINYVGASTSLSQLNDGRGIRTASGDDFQITDSAGVSYDINVSNLATVGSVLDAINSATGGKVTASIGADGSSIRLVDTAAGDGAVQVSALNGSMAARDLGLLAAPASDTEINGSAVLASLNSVLLSSLRGGSGLSMGQITITDRAGASNTIDLAGAKTVDELISRINSNGVAQVTARVKSSGNGIEIVDVSAGSGELSIADVNSTTASELGIAGTFSTATTVVRGANLQRQWVSENTLLSSYNGGRGVTLGKFKITNADGQVATVDLTVGTKLTLRDVIAEINNSGVATASINANGDGLLITDSTGGGGHLTIEDVSGRAAADLNIAGTATANTIDGSFEKTITVTDSDTLSSVVSSINTLAFAAGASIINDGSPDAPFRLSLSARNSGRNGRFSFDGGQTTLQTNTLLEAQDAVIFYGSAGGTQPLVLTSSSNQFSNVVQGVTIDARSVSTAPVTVSITEDSSGISGELKKFVETFNGLVEKLQELTKYDSETNARGLLLGDSTVQQIQTRLYAMIQSKIKGAGQFSTLSEVGLRLTEGAKLEFNEERFNAAYAQDSESVKRLFTMNIAASGSTPAQKGFGNTLEDRINSLIDPINGLITRQNQSLDRKTQNFSDRIGQLDKLLEAKRTRLERQFANLETVLSQMQSQQQALASFSVIQPMKSSGS